MLVYWLKQELIAMQIFEDEHAIASRLQRCAIGDGRVAAASASGELVWDESRYENATRLGSKQVLGRRGTSTSSAICAMHSSLGNGLSMEFLFPCRQSCFLKLCCAVLCCALLTRCFAYRYWCDLMQKTCLYSGWLYKKTDNVLSLVSGISSLNSWTRRYCMVLERGDPANLELALFRMKDGSRARPVCPTSVMLYNVAAGMETISDPRWFSRKGFTFLGRGDQLSKCHYRACSVIENPVHFAAIDQAGFDAWKVFFSCQQQRLAHRHHSIVNRHDNSVDWNSRSMVPAASLVTFLPIIDLPYIC